jgi:hypothetical protein
MSYDLEGRLQEICSCATICPCWAGKDPDGGTCGFSWVFHVDRGHVGGVEVAGMNMGFLGHLPGNVFDGNVRLLVLVDERASEVQENALLAAFTGKEGGPLADLAGLIGEVVGVERAPIEFDVDKGSGRFRAGPYFEGEVEGLRSMTGVPTTLNDAPVGPVLGSPAYPGIVQRYRVSDERHGLEFTAAQSTQSEFRYVCA